MRSLCCSWKCRRKNTNSSQRRTRLLSRTNTHTQTKTITHTRIDALASQLFSWCCSYCCILLCALALLCRCNYCCCYCCCCDCYCCCYSYSFRCFCLFPAAPLPLHSATVLHNVNYIFACYHHKNIIIYSFPLFLRVFVNHFPFPAHKLHSILVEM